MNSAFVKVLICMIGFYRSWVVLIYILRRDFARGGHTTGSGRRQKMLEVSRLTSSASFAMIEWSLCCGDDLTGPRPWPPSLQMSTPRASRIANPQLLHINYLLPRFATNSLQRSHYFCDFCLPFQDGDACRILNAI